MKAEEKDHGSGDGCEERAILEKKRTDGAGGCSKSNKNHGESGDESQGRSEKT